MNHLLDFSKIHSLTSRSRLTSADDQHQSSDDSSRLCVVDLGVLVQDVIEGIHIGFIARNPNSKVLANGNVDATSWRGVKVEQSGTNKCDENTIVLVDIDPSVNWIFQTESGAWKRIIMDIFGNALNNTSRGQVDVSLRLISDNKDMNSTSKHTEQIHIQINDTGRGFSTGLGLSIVKQLVDSLGGTINVQGKLGVGTQFGVMVPTSEKTRRMSVEQQLGEMRQHPQDTDDRFRGCNIYLPLLGSRYDLPGIPSKQSGISSSRTLAVRTVFADIAERWFGMEVVTEAQVGNVEDGGAGAGAGNNFTLLHNVLSSDSDRTLVVQPPAPNELLRSDTVSQKGLGALEVTKHHPFNPRKLRTALARAMDLKAMPRPTARVSNEHLSNPAVLNVFIPAQGIPHRFTSTRLKGEQTSKVEATSQPQQPTFSSDGERRQFNLLLVDDNDINLKILAACARKIGCTYVQTINGLKAVEAIGKGLFPST
ncbi:hypothetical protein K431DRAFT_304841 [Polychaeton citri CBS 116435]|uniref:histidine kinase n=1 Tax=Polychaeton citri CBS 116435 TaxID=1314669 RepID=A0A9P4UNJ2_9PEZI|nr:hypothetical protein K431DRAFT_304841 [Polychaeton citri CBS 116435]